MHADKDGYFGGLEIDEKFRAEHVVEEDLWVKAGDEVSSFKGANDAIGTLVLRFETEEELEEALQKQKNWLKVVVE